MIAFNLLAANTNRSLVYLTKLIEENLFPKKVFLVDTRKNQSIMEVETEAENLKKLEELLIRKNISYQIITADSVNDDSVCEAVFDCSEKLLVYSGFSGDIVRNTRLLKSYHLLHVHAGPLPSHKGSTTIYYTILESNTVTATALVLRENLDEGPVVYAATFPAPTDKTVIDFKHDPEIRSQVLIRALKIISQDGLQPSPQAPVMQPSTFYVIHPVLKHIAILK